MGMKENWGLFVESTKAKADSHMKVAQYWDNIHNIINLVLILFSAITTVLSLLSDDIPFYVTAAISGVTTILSAVSGFLQPSQRRQMQLESSKEFRTLMLRMVRCETEREYEELWKEYNKAIIAEPFLPKKFVVGCDMPYTMTPELVILIDEKEDEVARALADSDDDGDDEKEGRKVVKDVVNGEVSLVFDDDDKNNDV